MRLIDADAFDKVLRDAQLECKKNGGNFRYGVLATVRANLEKAPTVSGWISMNDRMPETVGEEYIVYITSNDGEKCVTCDHWVKSSHERWFLFDDAEAVVTHWMPLPEPPEVNDG